MAALRPLFCVVVSALLPFASVSLHAQTPKAEAHVREGKASRTLPLVFEGNQGQFPANIAFVGRTERYAVAIGAKDIRFALPGAHSSSQVVLSLQGSEASAPNGLAEAPFRTNYFVGSRPSDFRTGIRNYTRVGLDHVYPGIDVQFYANGNAIEHDFLVAAGADPSHIALQIAATGKPARLSAEGDVVIAGPEGELRLKKPVAYQQDAAGKHTEVAAAFVLAEATDPANANGTRELRFRLGAYDRSRPLIIDPLIVYGSFFDGKAGSTAAAVTADAAGDVYLAGSTASASTDFGVAAAKVASNPSGLAASAASAAGFVAKFNPAGSASPVAWLSYFGGTTGNTTPAAVALPFSTPPSPQAAYLSVGGSTLATDFPQIVAGAPSASPVVLAASMTRGFVASLDPTSGAIQYSTYITSEVPPATATTAVTALAVDSNGNVFAGGTATGSGLPTTALNKLNVNSSDATQKGFVYELTPALTAGSYISYLAGSPVATTNVTSIAVDSASDIYVGGYTTGSFPLAGTYITTTDPYAVSEMNVHNPADTTDDAFAAEIVPFATGTTIEFTAWLSGSSDDKVSAIALDPSATPSGLFLFGSTLSTDLLTQTTYTYAGGTTPITTATAGSAGTPVTATKPSAAPNTSGFIADLDPTGKPLAITYAGGAGVDAITAGAVGKNGAVYAAGSSTSAQSMGYTTTLLPGAQDSTAASAQHGFLLQLPGTPSFAAPAASLSAVNYIANIGSASGVDAAVGVALDSSANAYVAANIGTGQPYTVFPGFALTRNGAAGTSAAYVAEVASSATDLPLTLAAVACSTAASQPNQPVGCPDPIGFPLGGSTESVAYTWTLTPTASSTAVVTNVEVQIPAQADLTFQSVVLTDTTSATPTIPLTYTCSPSFTTGATCLITSYPQTSGNNDTVKITLNTQLKDQPTASTIAVTATVYGPGPTVGTTTDTQSATETSNVQAPTNLSITATQASPAGAVNTTNSGASSPNTLVTYNFTVTNGTGAGVATATNATFTITLPYGTGAFQYSSSTMLPSSCVYSSASTPATVTCTGLTIAPGGSFTVPLTGTYPDSAIGVTPLPSFAASASAFLSSPTLTFTPTTALQRGVHLAVTGSFNALPAGQTYFYLGDAVTYTVTVTNQGSSASSGSDTLTITIPTAFTPSSASPLACASYPCTVTLSTPIASGGTFQETITGTFQDSAANMAIGTTATGTTEGFSAATKLAASSVDTGGDATSKSSPTAVGRNAPLSILSSALSVPGTVCAGTGGCLYMTNPSHTADAATFAFTLQNTGKDTSVGTQITVKLPTAPGAKPVVSSAPSATGATPAFGSPVTCTYSSVTYMITCSGNLAANSNIPVSVSLAAPEGTVPTTSTSVSTSGGALGSYAFSDNSTAVSTTALPAIEIDRAAHLITTKTAAASGTTPSAPINLEENSASAAAGVNDTLTVTSNVSSAQLNIVPSASFTDTLPAFFHFTQLPKSTGATAATCVVTGTSTAITAIPNPTGAATTSMTCTFGPLNPPATPAAVGTPQVTVTYSGKFVDNGAAADVTGVNAASKVAQLNAPLSTAQSMAPFTVDPSTSQAQSTAPVIAVQRLVHMYLRKVRNGSVAAPPVGSSYTFNYPNLDSEPAVNTFGANDEVEYDVAVANGGVNKAVGVQFSDTLPPYFTLETTYLIAGAPATPDTGANAAPTAPLTNSLACYAGASATGTALTPPYKTGASSQLITCTYGIAANPLALSPGTAATPFTGTTPVELVYQGKFQDNAGNASASADDIPLGRNTYAVASNAGDAVVSASASVDNGAAADRSSAAVPVYSIQRAAHLTLVTPTLPVTDTGGNALSKATDGTSIAGEAQPSSNGGPDVFNCIRYKTYVQNSGPNFARQPQLSVALPTGLNLSSTSFGTTTTPNSDSPLLANCAYNATASTNVTGTALAPTTEVPGSSLIVDLDGYFIRNTLVGVNALGGFFPTYSTLSDSSIADSSTASAFMAVKGTAVTVVNTPYGTNFSVLPFTAAAKQPVAISFSAVGTPGITTLTVTSTLPASATLPRGTSPVTHSGTVTLYQAGASAPNFYTTGYTMGTGVATAAVTGATTLCVTNGAAALTDGFAKPERVLLWGLANIPATTTFQAVPNGITAPYAGDVTTTVMPLGLKSYEEAGVGVDYPYTTGSKLPAVQPQPAMVCGAVSGYATGAAPAVFAVLEPVDFPPIISPNPTTPSPTPGKGVSEVAYLFPVSFDPNNGDPCYVSSTSSGTPKRSACDDNLVLTTRIFGGESLIPVASGHVVGPLTPDAAASFVAAPSEVQAGKTFFFMVNDQLEEAAYLTKLCDPGINSNAYTVQGTNCPVTGLTGTTVLQQAADAAAGGGEVAQLQPSLNGGSSALIVLPQAATPTQFGTGVLSGAPTASGTITAGQTVGFLWRLRLDAGTTTGTYNLTCSRVDAATQTTVLAFPTGLTCQVPSSVVLPTDPAIYIVTQGALYGANRTPGWKEAGGVVFATLLVPFLLFRRRLSYPRQLVLFALLTLAGAAGVAGCGTGGSTSGASTAVAAGTYWFRVSATPVGGGTTVTSTAFSVQVVSGN